MAKQEKLFRQILLFALGIFTLAVLPQEAEAQKIKELFSKEMPKFQDIPDAQFEQMTELYEDVPFGDRYLAYKVRLPKDWAPPDDVSLSNYSLSSRLMGDIALFYSPPRIDAPRSKFQIQALKLEYEMTAEQWLLQFILQNGFTLEGLEYFSPDKVGALHVYVTEGETFVVRSVAQINGKRMVLAQYIVPANYWMKEAPMIAESLATFELLNPEKAVIENMVVFPFLDIAQFSYPESWDPRSNPVRTIDRIQATVNNIREGASKTLDGQIQVDMVSAFIVDDLEAELDNLKENLREKGLITSDLIETKEDTVFHPQVNFGFTDVFEGNNTENNVLRYEIWISVLALDNYYFFVTLITPHRDEEFFTWSRNVGAYKALLKTVQMQKKGMNIKD